MSKKTKIIIQGFPGSFHDEVSRKFFVGQELDILPAKSFGSLTTQLEEDHSIDFGVMAIENSIAGSILQNYYLLREHRFWICGEAYLKIRHQLMALPGQSIADIHTAESHPMAIYQCRQYFKKNRHISLKESEDTALSAKFIADKQILGAAAIASSLAAKLYGLEIIAPNIETSDVNYTRFVVVSRERPSERKSEANKASIYLRVPHEHGSLLKVLEALHRNEINLSKLQSYPVLGELNTYYFHLDLEFDGLTKYNSAIEEVKKVSSVLEELGVYSKATIDED